MLEDEEEEEEEVWNLKTTPEGQGGRKTVAHIPHLYSTA